MRAGRHTRTATAILAGMILGTGVVVGAEALSDDVVVAPRSAPAQVPDTSPPSIDRPSQRPVRTVMLAWMPGGLPPEGERFIEALPGVRDATTSVAGLEWMQRSETSDGTVVDEPTDGYALPLEVAFIDPRGYARFVSPVERTAVATLRKNEMLFAQTQERLRGGGRGLVVSTDNGTRTVTGVIRDRATNGYEALVAGPPPREWFGGDRFVLAHLRSSADRRRIERRITSHFDDEGIVRVRLQGESPFLRYGDAVMPQLLIKEAFGEFAARPLPDGRVEVDPRWRASAIMRGRVPILGQVSCHRRLFGQLRASLSEIRSEQLSFLIDPSDYGGCYSARFVSTSSAQRLSHHTWGIAIDINVAENAFGTKPDQDDRVVRIFESHGFTWGGRWLIPDGMHFEWTRFP
jgi:hypothetical protein